MLNIRLPSDGQHLRQNTYEVLGNLENGLATRRIAHTEAIRNSKIQSQRHFHRHFCSTFADSVAIHGPRQQARKFQQWNKLGISGWD